MNYVCGLIFNKELNKILLIHKNRGPECVKDKLNFPGGKCEIDESPLDAIYREILEETKLNFKQSEWTFICKLLTGNDTVYFYYIVTDDIFYFKQIEDEIVDIYNLKVGDKYDDKFGLYHNYPVVANVNWLIPMALNHYKKLDPAKSFTIIENF